MAIYGHEWSLLMGESHWALFFLKPDKTIRFFWAYLPEKRESVWTECSRCSSACTLPWWALSFPNIQWANPVRHTQHVTRPQSLPRKKNPWTLFASEGCHTFCNQCCSIPVKIYTAALLQREKYSHFTFTQFYCAFILFFFFPNLSIIQITSEPHHLMYGLNQYTYKK